MLKSLDRRLFYVLLFVVFFFLNYFTPLQSDDYGYAFNYEDHSRIENVADVFQSQLAHYVTTNGRTVPHIFEQIFAGITGKWLFDVMNAFLMVVLLVLVTAQLVGRHNDSAYKEWLVLNASCFALLFLSSYPGQSIFWMAGGLNYLLPTVMALWIFKIFLSHRSYNRFGLFVIALLSGWMQEGISIPVSVTLFLLYVVYKRYRNTRNQVLLTGYIGGMMLIVMSPGTLARLASGELHTTGDPLFVVVNKLLETNACLHGLYIFWISLVLVLALALFRKWDFFKKQKELLLLWLMNFLFFVALGFPHERITLLLSVVSFMLVMKMILPLVMSRGYDLRKFLMTLLVLGNGIGAAYAMRAIYLHQQYQDGLIASVVASKEAHVVLPLPEAPEVSRFTFPLILSADTQSSVNRNLAAYYDKESVQFLEPGLYQAVKQVLAPAYVDSLSTDFVSEAPEMRLYAAGGLHYLKLDGSCFVDGVLVEATHVAQNGDLKPRQRFIRTVMGTLDEGKTELEPLLLMKSDGTCYCFVPHLAKREEAFEVRSAKNGVLLGAFVKRAVAQ